jgi:hypothetical protein
MFPDSPLEGIAVNLRVVILIQRSEEIRRSLGGVEKVEASTLSFSV